MIVDHERRRYVRIIEEAIKLEPLLDVPKYVKKRAYWRRPRPTDFVRFDPYTIRQPIPGIYSPPERYRPIQRRRSFRRLLLKLSQAKLEYGLVWADAVLSGEPFAVPLPKWLRAWRRVFGPGAHAIQGVIRAEA